MKTQNISLTNAVETGPGASAEQQSFSKVCRAKLDALKASLVRKLSAEFSDLKERLVQRAVEEADALAAATGFPFLTLPELALEKVQQARAWDRRQETIFRRSRQALALAATAVLAVACAPSAVQPVPPAPSVTVARVDQQQVVEWDEFTGRTEAVEAVEIRPRVSGYIQEVRFQSGQLVKKGDVLFVIDPRWHQAAFNNLQAEADRANVQLENAKREADRAAELLGNKAISTEEADERVARFQEAKAAMLAAQAARDSARLDLDYTQVRAPIDGRVSRAFLTEGNYVSGVAGGSSLLTTLVSVNPVYVYADVDEDSLLRFNTLAHDQKIQTNGNGQVPIELQLADETDFPHRGCIESFDNRVDPNTGSIILRAVFGNDDGRIVPGLFARIRVPLSDLHPAILVPERAIGTDQAQKYVLTLTSSNTVAYNAVKLGPSVGGKRVVRSGLPPGAQIIVNGMERVRPGMPVTPEQQAAISEGARVARVEAPGPSQP